MAALRPVSLSDKYLQQDGVVYLSGMQALVRLPLLQRERDRIAGLHTAGLITGYRGSPIGGYDRELARVGSLLAGHQLRFQPGLNEELAATVCWGAQQIELFPGGRHAGVFCIWYGKGPGLDRSTDAIKHASHYGTSRLGGRAFPVEWPGDSPGSHSTQRRVPDAERHQGIEAACRTAPSLRAQVATDAALFEFRPAVECRGT